MIQFYQFVFFWLLNIKNNSGVFFIQSSFIGAKADAAANLAETIKSAESQLKNSALYTSMQALRNSSTIKDKRAKFL